MLIETKRIRHKFYQLMKFSPWNYITNITHRHMKQSMHINVSIPVTNIHIEQSMHINVSIPVTNTHVKRTEK